MASTAAERKRRSRERQKEEERKKPDGTHPFLREPFFEWMGSGKDDVRWQEVTFNLGLIGIEFKPFEDDTGATAVTASFDEWGTDEGYYDQFQGSVGRAELMVSCLLDAAGAVALHLNRYKLEQIKLAIADLENSDLSDPAAKKQALADIVQLTKFRDRLNRQRRWSLPEWTVKSS
jgi:hypothetical protein